MLSYFSYSLGDVLSKKIVYVHIVYKVHCDAWPNLVLFVQFKKREIHPWKSVTFSKVGSLLKVTLLYGCFFKFFKLYIWYQIVQNFSIHVIHIAYSNVTTFVQFLLHLFLIAYYSKTF